MSFREYGLYEIKGGQVHFVRQFLVGVGENAKDEASAFLFKRTYKGTPPVRHKGRFCIDLSNGRIFEP